MNVQKIESPCWNNGIKETLSQYSHSFEFVGVPDDYPLDQYEWWSVVNEKGATLGVGWIDIDNFMGEIDCEISLCVNSQFRDTKGIGSRLLECLEHEAVIREVDVLSAVVKRSNPEHNYVVDWFEKRGYIIDKFQSNDNNTCLMKRLKKE